jgi:hypothetical protein
VPIGQAARSISAIARTLATRVERPLDLVGRDAGDDGRGDAPPGLVVAEDRLPAESRTEIDRTGQSREELAGEDRAHVGGVCGREEDEHRDDLEGGHAVHLPEQAPCRVRGMA